MLRQFAKKISLLALLLLGTVAALFILPFFLPNNATDYFAAYIDKHRLLAETPSPRIIVIGGSSTAFGINSEMIAQQTRYPVINMGLNIGMGLAYTLEEVRSEIGKGDIILLSPEYEQFTASQYKKGGAPSVLVAIDPTSMKYTTSLKQVWKVFSGLNVMFRVEATHLAGAILGHPVRCTGGLYCRDSFNAQGDFMAHLEENAHLEIPEHITPIESTLSEESFQSIEDFATYANSKDAQVLFTFPPLAQSYFETNKVVITSIAERVKKVPNLKMIDSPENHEYPNEMFFDSEYHLNKKGRDIRTDQILSSAKII